MSACSLGAAWFGWVGHRFGTDSAGPLVPIPKYHRHVWLAAQLPRPAGLAHQPLTPRHSSHPLLSSTGEPALMAATPGVATRQHVDAFPPCRVGIPGGHTTRCLHDTDGSTDGSFRLNRPRHSRPAPHFVPTTSRSWTPGSLFQPRESPACCRFPSTASDIRVEPVVPDRLGKFTSPPDETHSIQRPPFFSSLGRGFRTRL
jgi:hypothetical protein